jgi:hypothetical protein
LIVELTFDFWVECHFYWTGRLPIALMEEIGRRKNEIYQSLSPDPQDGEILVGQEGFTLGGRDYLVLFAADQRRIDMSSDTRPLRVLHIDELS